MSLHNAQHIHMNLTIVEFKEVDIHYVALSFKYESYHSGI